jgi:hypothetical protein
MELYWQIRLKKNSASFCALKLQVGLALHPLNIDGVHPQF